MHADIAAKREAIAALCRRFGVIRLEVFGSAACGTDFDPVRSDADLLVTFLPEAGTDLAAFADLKDALEALLKRPVGLVDRDAVEGSRNRIRSRRILAEGGALYG